MRRETPPPDAEDCDSCGGSPAYAERPEQPDSRYHCDACAREPQSEEG